MPKAVQFNHYGDLDALDVVEVARPHAGEHQVVVEVKAAGINPGEAKIRQGQMHSQFPATFPSGEGTDFAGVVAEVGPGVTAFNVGDEVAGYTFERASHAEYVVVNQENVTLKPANVSWEVAGGLFVAGTTAYATVEAVNVRAGDKVVVSGAAGGVGAIAIQLAKLRNAEVYGIAGAHDHAWLSAHGIVPIDYSGDVAAQIKAKMSVPDAFIDTIGKGYVKLAIELGVAPQRIDTIIDFAAVQQYGVKAEGHAEASRIEVLAELLALVERGALDAPIARTFALDDVRDAFRFLDEQHHRGKVVLTMNRDEGKNA